MTDATLLYRCYSENINVNWLGKHRKTKLSIDKTESSKDKSAWAASDIVDESSVNQVLFILRRGLCAGQIRITSCSYSNPFPPSSHSLPNLLMYNSNKTSSIYLYTSRPIGFFPIKVVMNPSLLCSSIVRKCCLPHGITQNWLHHWYARRVRNTYVTSFSFFARPSHS